MNGFQYFLGCSIRLRQMELIVFVVFYLETNFPRKQTKLKDFFLSLLLTGLMPSHILLNMILALAFMLIQQQYLLVLLLISLVTLCQLTLVDTNRKI